MTICSRKNKIILFTSVKSKDRVLDMNLLQRATGHSANPTYLKTFKQSVNLGYNLNLIQHERCCWMFRHDYATCFVGHPVPSLYIFFWRATPPLLPLLGLISVIPCPVICWHPLGLGTRRAGICPDIPLSPSREVVCQQAHHPPRSFCLPCFIIYWFNWILV